MAEISAYIIAYNEEDKIAKAVASVDWADEVVVADSFSTDQTAEIARSLGARVVQIPFSGFGELRNQAIAACSHEWIFSLDSDERCTENARREIVDVIRDPDALDAYYVPRRNYFMGKWIKHAGFYPDYRQPQLFKKGALRFRDDKVHERYDIISSKEPGYLKSFIHQIPYKSLEEFMHKANRYSTLGGEKLLDAGRSPSLLAALLHGFWAFFSMYVLKGGFLDGWPGLIIGIGNFEGTFYKYAKAYLKLENLESFLNQPFPDE